MDILVLGGGPRPRSCGPISLVLGYGFVEENSARETGGEELEDLVMVLGGRPAEAEIVSGISLMTNSDRR